MSSLDARKLYEALAVTEAATAHGFDIRYMSRDGPISCRVVYDDIHHFAYDRGHWTRIVISVSASAIEIRGWSLRPVIDAIRMHTCGFIQEYSLDEHILPEPADPTAPFIESISVAVIGGQAPRDQPDGD